MPSWDVHRGWVAELCRGELILVMSETLVPTWAAFYMDPCIAQAWTLSCGCKRKLFGTRDLTL